MKDDDFIGSNDEGCITTNGWISSFTNYIYIYIYVCVCVYVCVRRRYAVAISVALLVQYINFWRNSSEAVVKRDFLPLVWRHAIDELTLNDHSQNILQTLSNGFGPFGMTKRASFGMASLSSVG